jgi:hypothetical protein
VVQEIIRVFLKVIGQKNGKQAHMSQIMTAALIAMKYFGTNYPKALKPLSIFLASKRKTNAKNAPFQKILYDGKKRKIIETTFSSILKNTLRNIHAITRRTLELNLSIMIIAHAFFS